MGEYASKGVAGTGLGLGIAGTALGVLAGSQGGNGLLGGLFGGNQMGQLMAENSQLKAEKYSDQSGIAIYKELKSDINRNAEKAFNDLTTVRSNILSEWVKPLAQESASNRERLVALESKVDGNFALQAKDMEILRKDIEIASLRTDAKIDQVAGVARTGIVANSTAIAGLEKVVNGIICTKVCRDAICPEVMPRYNSWVAPTAEAPATQPVTGAINIA